MAGQAKDIKFSYSQEYIIKLEDYLNLISAN